MNKLKTSLEYDYKNKKFPIFLDDMVISIRAGEYDKDATTVIQFLQGIMSDQNVENKSNLDFLIYMLADRTYQRRRDTEQI
jgi:hypothetical protein